MTITCDGCGSTVPIHAGTCPHCGRPQLIGAADGSTAEDTPSSPSEDSAAGASEVSELPEASRRGWTFGRAFGSCLVAFACVVLVFLAIGGAAVYQGLQERAALTRQQATVHYQRGLAHLEAGEFELAMAEFEHTLRLDAAHREARDALRDAKTIALAQPTPTSATLNEATIAILAEAEALLGEQKWPQAIQRLSQLRDLAPDFQSQLVSELLYTAYFNQALDLASRGQVNEGVYAFEQALAERPGDAEAGRQLDLASLYVSAQATWGADWPSTIDYLEQLYTLAADYLDVSNKLYQAYEAYGNALAAEQAWCLAELQYKEAALLKPSVDLQSRWEDASRLCRTPSPTPGPKVTATSPLTRTARVTATSVTTQTSALSASGSILFSRFNTKDARWEIVAATPGEGSLAVIHREATQPASSPNGQLLAYHAEVDESEGLHVLEIATGNDIRVTNFREDVTPDWAPDSLRFVFPSQRSGDRRWQIYVGWADGKGDPVPLVDGRTPAWSPDGGLIAYQGTDTQGNNPGIYLISAEGGPGFRLTDDESDRAPAWSPRCAQNASSFGSEGIDESLLQDSVGSDCRLMFMSNRVGNWEIYDRHILAGTLKRVTNSRGNDGLPTWSPDGNHIAFVSDRDGSWGVYVVAVAGGEPVRVADWGEQRSDWLLERITWVR